MEYILVIDSGSTSVRAVLFDLNGQIKYQENEAITLINPQEGYLEYDPEEIWNATSNVVEQVLKNIKDLNKN